MKKIGVATLLFVVIILTLLLCFFSIEVIEKKSYIAGWSLFWNVA